MDIQALRAVNAAETIVITQHGRKRLSERGISIRDIISVIASGEIIEEYPDDHPFPSCLILGCSVEARFLHVVVSLDAGLIYLITAYFPDPAVWKS